MQLTSEQQEQLRTALVTAFGDRPFDATSVVVEAEVNSALATALVAIIPQCTNVSKERRFRFREVPIRKAIRQLVLDTDYVGYWLNLRGQEPSGPACMLA